MDFEVADVARWSFTRLTRGQFDFGSKYAQYLKGCAPFCSACSALRADVLSLGLNDANR